MPEQQIRFDDGASYERMMGVWSQLAGNVFLDWPSAEVPPDPMRIGDFQRREHCHVCLLGRAMTFSAGGSACNRDKPAHEREPSPFMRRSRTLTHGHPMSHPDAHLAR